MESRCILGFEATGLRPCGWFPLGSLSKVWLPLCDIFIALVGVFTDDINSDGVKVHFGFPGNWFGTLRMIPTGIAKLSVMVSAILLSHWLVSALTISRVMESRCTLGFQATGLPYFYRFGWCLPWRHQEWPPRCVLVPSNWFATLRVIATRIVKRSVKGSLLYFYRFGWCLLWLFWVPRQLVVHLVGDSHEDR